MEKRTRMLALSLSTRVLAFILISCCLGVQGLFAQTSTVRKVDTGELEQRAAYYLDQRTNAFLQEMVRKEKHLLQLVQNITAELALRDPNFVTGDQFPLTAVYGHSEHLVAEYELEIKRLTALVSDINRLKKTAKLQRQEQMIFPIATLENEVRALFDDWETFKQSGSLGEGYVKIMLQQYAQELDNLVNIYREMDLMRLDKYAKRDSLILKDILTQRENISAMLNRMIERPVYDWQIDEFAAGFDSLEAVVRSLQTVERSARAINEQVSAELNALESDILERLDARLVALLDRGRLGSGTAFALQIFDAWKKKELAEYEKQLLSHRIIKDALLVSGRPSERTRMLEADLQNAFRSYEHADYDFAAEQFTELLQDYELYFHNLENVVFYRADCYYQRKLYNLAKTDYETVLQQSAGSEYLNETFFRLLLIADKQNDFATFYKHFDLFRAFGLEGDEAIKNKCHYLAATVFYRDGRFAEIGQVLAGIPRESEVYHSGRFLEALSHVALENYDTAIAILEVLASERNYPWSAARIAHFRNQAVLELGYIQYELKNYTKAAQYFTSVSPGFAEYDYSLIGAAWSNLQLRKYARALVLANTVLEEQLNSEAAYEAFVLSAQCKRHLQEEDSALDDLRYVTTAKRLFSLADVFNEEKRKLLTELNALNGLEAAAIEQQDTEALADIESQRKRIYRALPQFEIAGGAGPLWPAFVTEGDSLLDLIEQAETAVAKAEKGHDAATLKSARGQLNRLFESLGRYNNLIADRKSRLVRHRPRPALEISGEYQNEILSKLAAETASEQEQLLNRLQEIRALQAATRDEKERLDLESLAIDLTATDRQVKSLQGWLETRGVEPVESNFQEWANVSGTGVSDITFNRMQTKDDEIELLATNSNSVTKVIEKRKQFLDQRLLEYDEIIRELEYNIQREKFERYRQENEEYFQNSYFDQEEREYEPQPEPQAEPEAPAE